MIERLRRMFGNYRDSSREPVVTRHDQEQLDHAKRHLQSVREERKGVLSRADKAIQRAMGEADGAFRPDHRLR